MKISEEECSIEEFHKKLRNAIISMRETVDKSSGMWMCLFASQWEKANENGMSHEEFFDWWVDQMEKGYLKEVLKRDSESEDDLFFCPWCFLKYPKSTLDFDYICPECGESIQIKKKGE